MLRIESALRDAGSVRRPILLARINPILSQLEEITRDYAKSGISEHFVKGSDEAIAQLKKVRGIEVDDTFTTPQKEVLQRLADEAVLNLGEAIRGLRQNAVKTIGRAEKQKALQQILVAEIEGASNPAARVKEVFEQAGLTAITTGNRRLSLDHYASMVTHTVLAEAYNMGAATRYTQNGVEFARRIERSDAPDYPCQWLRDKIVWLGEPAFIKPLHPNCFGSISPFFGDASEALRSVDDPRIPAEVRKQLVR